MGTKKTATPMPDDNNGQPKKTPVVIAPPKMQVAEFHIRGIEQLVINRFGARSMEDIKNKQMQGSQSKKGTKRVAKDFQAMYEDAKHLSTEGWCGISASAFRNAMISACRMVGFKMTIAKMSVFILADGEDKVDKTPLIKITKGEPEYFESVVRPQLGVTDIHARPRWAPGWEAMVKVRWDMDQFSAQDVANLLARAGLQVGIGEGRPDSKSSCGMGWGLFELVKEEGVD